ncbi:MAG: hypothetical protein IPH50_01875 [Rhodanobacteraceae bacterium]|nr:hypothetical protein [Rhodanobacteraceae bacterium]
MQIQKLLLHIILSSLLLTGCLTATAANERPDVDPNAFWQDVDETQVQARGERWLNPQTYRALVLDFSALSARAASAPMERAGDVGIRLALPMPDGGYTEFMVTESPVMEPGLSAKYPSIRTYAGQGIQDPHARLRFDVTPIGFHAQVLSPNGDFLIDPLQKNDTDHYVSYFRRDYGPNTKQYRCDTEDSEISATTLDTAPSIAKLGTPNTVGTQLRSLRTAIVATSSYTNLFGGTVAAGLSGVTTLVNRLNGVYERDVALRFVLVANNDLIVYTNSNVGPIGAIPTGPNPIIQTTIDNAIGFANYDIGHAVGGSGGGGAITPLGNVCTAQKSQGFTSFDTAIGDIFDIDFVSHELGHQLGGSHTWNGCSDQQAGQWTATSAMEPGSGTTIMAYAGICSDNLQPNSDANLHARTFTQLVARLALDETSTAPTCGSNTPTGNQTPNVTAAADLTIPEQTPFQLTVAANDPDGDVLVYNWEELDTGTRGAPTATGDNGTAPLFRSFNPTTSPTRNFPSLPYILDNSNIPPATISLPPAAGSYYTAERLPNPASGTRVMNFRATVGDNRAGGAGVAYDQIVVTASSAAGPFAVVNLAGPLTGGASQAVTWNVANTTAAPVSTSTVNILISLDGGYTFTTLLAGTANDGSETVTIPNIATARARIKVEAANGTGISTGNTYFDITDSNFAITASGTAVTVSTSANAIATKQGSPAPAPVQIATISGGTIPYTLAAAAFPESAEISIVSLSEAAGSVSASAQVSCRIAAPNAPSFRIYPAVLQVTDATGRKASGVFPIRVSNNDIPSIGTYTNPTVATGGSVSVVRRHCRAIQTAILSACRCRPAPCPAAEPSASIRRPLKSRSRPCRPRRSAPTRFGFRQPTPAVPRQSRNSPLW